MSEDWKNKIEKVSDNEWRIPPDARPGMRVPGIVFANETLMQSILKDQALEQVANVACLPGIVKYSFGMPDLHWGYGFPIGGVAATEVEGEGVITPGGVGYDINCGVRLITSKFKLNDIKETINDLMTQLFRDIPCGVGVGGGIKVNKGDARHLLTKGSEWMKEKGFATEADVEHTESRGSLKEADPDAISPRAFERGADQVGTLGAGNHFLEVQVVDQIFDEQVAKAFGIELNGITVMIHCGSRGFGHETASDYIKLSRQVMSKYHINVPDSQLAGFPVRSPEGNKYFGAMCCAANYAWANRQYLTYLTRKSFEHYFKKKWEEMGLTLVYDVAHNIAKIETHDVDGKPMKLCVHRKGATRAFPPGNSEIPSAFRSIGQPVIIPGDMGRYSYVMVGTQHGMDYAFGTTCHGAGRMMSRTAAIKAAKGHDIAAELRSKGIVIKAKSREGIAEEQPAAYKDVKDVVEVVDSAGLARKVARMRPLGVIKG
jgi:tRNA-splicing ligase RtcB (3'-phosphate/5'-hydroxy nucleic acid ligase)